MRITSLVRRSFLATFALGATLAIPSTSAAQDLTALTAPAASSLSIAAPQPVALSLVGPRPVQAGVTRLAPSEALSMAAMRGPSRRNTAWMIFGGATLVVGSVIGGDAGTIMMVTGGVVGLVGLFRYLE